MTDDVIVDLLSSDDEGEGEPPIEETSNKKKNHPPPLATIKKSCSSSMMAIDLCSDDDDDDNQFTVLTPTAPDSDVPAAVTVSAARRRKGGSTGENNKNHMSPVRYNSQGYQSDSDLDEATLPLGLAKQSSNNATTTTSQLEKMNVRGELPAAIEKKNSSSEPHILEVDLSSSSDEEEEAPLSQSMETTNGALMPFVAEKATTKATTITCSSENNNVRSLQPTTVKRIEVDLLSSDSEDDECKQPSSSFRRSKVAIVQNPSPPSSQPSQSDSIISRPTTMPSQTTSQTVVKNPYKKRSTPPSSQSSSHHHHSDSLVSSRTTSNRQQTPSPQQQEASRAQTAAAASTNARVVNNPYKRTSASKKPSPRQQYDSDDSDADLFTNDGPTFSVARKRSSNSSSPRDVAARAPSSTGSYESRTSTASNDRPTSLTSKRPSAHRSSHNDDDDSDSDLELVPSTATFAKKKSSPSQSISSSSASPPVSSSTPNSRRQQQQQQQQLLQYPTLLSTSKQYPDLRAKYALALWKFGRSLTPHAYERSRLDQAMKKVARLVLSQYPIRSLEEFMMQSSSVTISDQQKKEVARQLEAGGVDRVTTPASRYGQGFYTIVEATLVALYDHVQQQQTKLHYSSTTTTNKSLTDVLKDKDSWLSTKDLIVAVDQRLRPECPSKLTRRLEPDGGALYYLEPSTRSAEFLQISKLECELGDEVGPRIKRRRKQGQVFFELLESGYADAKRIRGRSFPSPPGHYRCSKITIPEDHYKGICLGVDRQEGGVGNVVLHGMCGKLDMQRVPYFVGSLAIGDYVFFTSKGGRGHRLDYLCPIIIERKSIQDVAMSIHDGRWKSQKARMYKGQYIFGYNKCRMVYIIEGNEKKQLVSGNYIGTRFHNVDIDRLNEELDNLTSEGFDIVRTPSRENTMFELARWARRVAKEIRDGTLQASFTYQQFKDELKKIPKETDFSRLAKYHAAQKQGGESGGAAVETRDKRDSRVQASVGEREAASVGERGSRAEASTRGKAKVDDNGVPVERVAKRQKIEEDVDDKLGDLTTSRLKELCKNAGLAASGKRSDLMDRYRGPHPPKLWLTRKKRGQHVPASYNTGGTALLVALYLHEKKTGGLDKGLSKDELYVKAEGLNISKNPFSGGTTQTGPYHYDGWSSMNKLLHGDPALVKLSKKRYKLTRSCDLAGYKVAEAMHKWCHEHDHCPCGG